MSSVEYRLEPIAQCLDRALAFRNENRPNERPESYLRWRYLARPCPVPAYVVWAVEQGKTLGAATVAPHDFSVGGRDVTLGVVGDISVSADAQGRGVGSGLLQVVRTELAANVTDVIVLPNRAAEGPLKRAGWVRVGEIQRSVRPLRADGVADFAKLALSVLATVGRHRPGPRAGLTVTPLTEAARSLDALWDGVRGEQGALAYRNADYLNWRYFCHPTQRFTVSAINVQTEIAGYVVWHDDADGRWLDDFLVDRRLCVDDVALAAVSAARHDRQTRVHLRQYGGMDRRGWQSAGFLRRPDSQSVLLGNAETATMFATLSPHFTSGDKDA